MEEVEIDYDEIAHLELEDQLQILMGDAIEEEEEEEAEGSQ